MNPDSWSQFDPSPIWLSLQLATVTTLILLCLTLPLAWWLAHCKGRWKSLISAITTLPLVLPPSVLGFYMLMLLGSNGPLQPWIGSLAFTFPGLVIASIIYSLPFALQPIQSAFEQIGRRPVEVAATLRAAPLDRFVHVILPQARPGIISATVLSFAHTIGEFGVILMIGGNIPGETRVLSIAIYDHVEALEYQQAHWLSAGMLVFSFLVLYLLSHLNNAHSGLMRPLTTATVSREQPR